MGYLFALSLGQPHNIVRHPDMPPAAFEHMWSTLKSGRSWMGLVKNRCKNGDHYWVSAYVTPIAKNGSIVEYQSVRTKPEPEQVLAAEKLYAQLRSGKAARPKLAASFSVKILLLIWGSIISSAMAAGMLTDTSISSLLLATLMLHIPVENEHLFRLKMNADSGLRVHRFRTPQCTYSDVR
ncbi:PAS domain-containing protein [Aeromonas caviae]